MKNRTFLSFQLEEEVFAVDVSQVHKVLEVYHITKLPGTPDFMRGIINLRGQVVPIVDMRLKFGMKEQKKIINTFIIVLEIGAGNHTIIIGIVVDSVKEVFEFNEGEVEPPPRFGASSNIDFIRGIGKHNEQFIILLDFNRVFSTDEVVILEAAGDEDSDLDEHVLDAGKEENTGMQKNF